MGRRIDYIKKNWFWCLLLSIILGAAIGSFVMLTMFYSANVGEVVLVVDPLSHEVSQPIVGPLWSFKSPWMYVVKIYYATDTYEDTIPCFTSDQLEMSILIQIRWDLNLDKIHNLYLSYPTLNYKSTIESITEQIMKTITKDYTALETISSRSEVIENIQNAVLEALTEAPSLEGALNSLEFNLRDITYPEGYTEAIEAKLVAEQEKIQAEFEKERLIILANATAQEAIIEAEGEAQAKVIIANGTREALQSIFEAAGVNNSEHLTELYLYLETLKNLNVTSYIIVTGSDGLPVIYQIPG